jgi:DNA-binding NarL/FixJ family response regulator
MLHLRQSGGLWVTLYGMRTQSIVSGRPRILVLDDDALFCRGVRRALSASADVVAASTRAEADAALADGGWAGFIVELSLRDGSGLDWLALVRARGDVAPALVVTRVCKRSSINRAFRLGAGYLCKPFKADALRPFEKEVLRSNELADARRPLRSGPVRFATLAAEFGREHGLTRCETEIVVASLAGSSRAEIVTQRCVSMNTYKTQVKGILRKVGAGSLRALRDRLLGELDG